MQKPLIDRKNRIMTIYERLLDAFGEQGWWPLTPEGEIKPVHNGDAPRNERDRFEVIVGAILTQNTSWRNVERAIESLNKKNLLDMEKIGKCSHKELAEAIRSAGYYNQKADRIKNFVAFLKRKYDGRLANLFSKELKELRKELLSLNGIGKETADSIILYAAEKPIFVIDAYTKRIMKRLGFEFDNYDNLQNLFMKNLPNNVYIFKEYHALLVNLGKIYCTKRNPKCNQCPLKDMCNFVPDSDYYTKQNINR